MGLTLIGSADSLSDRRIQFELMKKLIDLKFDNMVIIYCKTLVLLHVCFFLLFITYYSPSRTD